MPVVGSAHCRGEVRRRGPDGPSGMCAMKVEEVGTRIMIFLSEDDRVGRHGLHETLVERARQDGMAGATIWRGIEGYGASGHVRTARFPDANLGLPVAVELIDRPERIEEFLLVVRELAPGSLVTRERVQTTRLRSTTSPASDDRRTD